MIDGHGECCTGGAVDACGVCGGSALLVDASYFCCNSGVLDSGKCNKSCERKIRIRLSVQRSAGTLDVDNIMRSRLEDLESGSTY